MPAVQSTPDEIWADDLFGRKLEAEQLSAYIESVLGRPIVREDKKAYTIAVDAQYGEGKTYFLKRLAQHLGINHPVAFVDAWADDLSDEPLTALAATLEEALAPFEADPKVQRRVATFMSKTGKVVRIAGVGLLKRGLGLMITGASVDAAADVLGGVSNEAASAVKDAAKDAAAKQIDEVEAAIHGVTAHSLMEERVARFHEGKAAVREMKDSLSAIVGSLHGLSKHPPIVIIIDELDRCRPTYAIKLLEEIKHLFDVPGLVFIMALHSEQLAHSVRGAYGPSFDGRAYLRRFIDREFALATPPLDRLVSLLCEQAGISGPQLRFPLAKGVGDWPFRGGVPSVIAEYIRAYGLSARDTFSLVDGLQTCVAFAEGKRLEGAYLLPLLIGNLTGLKEGALPALVRLPRIKFFDQASASSQTPSEYTIDAMANDFSIAAGLTNQQINNHYGTITSTFAIEAIAHSRAWNADPLPMWDVSNYPLLVRMVGRFKIPPLSDTDDGKPKTHWIT